ncbi:MAG: hypothetical protein OHK0023_06800 [Anaerolineae bacterium]
MSIGAYSFLFFAGVGVVIAALIILRIDALPPVIRVIGVAAVAVLAVVIWLMIRPTNSQVATIAEFDAVLADGKPVVLEFFSEY